MLSVQRALLGAIKPHMRAVYVGHDEKSIFLKLFVDQIVTEDDLEDISVIGNEVIADFPWANIIEECVFSEDRQNTFTVKNFTAVAYARHEL
ncbi:hypothetical protein [Spirosoma jeollabukense]